MLFIQPHAERFGSDHALLRMVRRLHAAGWTCDVVFPAASPMAAEFEAAGARLHTVPMRRLTTTGSGWRWPAYALAWPASVARLWWLGRRLRPDVVHTNALHSWYGWAVAALLRRPHVWHAREIVVQSSLALRVERFLTRHFATMVVAISDAVAAQFDAGNVRVILDEADPVDFGPQRAGRFRPQVGIDDGVPLVGAVSRVDTWKGLDVLLDGVDDLRRRHPDAQVVIAGGVQPGKEAYAEGLRRRAAATPGVHWLGVRSDVGDLMADLDVFVLASTEPEPFGLVLVEALTSGTPVVATAAGGPLEILAGVPPQVARLVPPGDAGALAEAVADLLAAAVPSSTDGRRARPRLRRAPSASWSDLFAEVIDRARP